MEFSIEIFLKYAIKIFHFIHKLASNLELEQRLMAMRFFSLLRFILEIFIIRASLSDFINEHNAHSIDVQDYFWNDIR
jgi:hypothetical protein